LRRLLDDSVSIDRAYREINANRPTPQVTVEAIKQAVRDGGESALNDSATQRRLDGCDQAALDEIERWLLARAAQ
jgi:hypothetical protein